MVDERERERERESNRGNDSDDSGSVVVISDLALQMAVDRVVSEASSMPRVRHMCGDLLHFCHALVVKCY